jgi:hypothetical protein
MLLQFITDRASCINHLIHLVVTKYMSCSHVMVREKALSQTAEKIGCLVCQEPRRYERGSESMDCCMRLILRQDPITKPMCVLYYVMSMCCVLQTGEEGFLSIQPSCIYRGGCTTVCIPPPFATVIYTQTSSDVGETPLIERGSRLWPHS